ncbi:2-dehydropantoate 2-reductase [Oxobacter pfennigii]|uniref:2-dehydropantoate 2-reductase n=1 Tax=Oxobacter pfennigii TaxID=36849 RepID=A0A0P8WC27_9CLOT|nr:ketopantoate reductase family protein [Oxobacter pfennigii]KPU45461.1 2-dehydropantoate 2-reductase [Oxobacter pfennigii]
MKKIEKVSLIGLGAIGASYAAKISDMDKDCIKIIADKDRIERYSRDGFYINDKLYNFNYIAPEEKTAPADLILVSVKFHDLYETIKAIKNHVGPGTTIVSLMNGISSEDIIGSEYGMDRMLYAMCVAIDAVREGNKIHYENFGQVHFGEKENKVLSEKAEAVKDLFERADIPHVVPESMIRTLWWKFMVNVGINQTSAVLKAPYGVFQRVKEANDLMTSAAREVVLISQKMGINLNEKDIEEFVRVMNTLSSDGKTSMLQDVEAGRKTEVEMLAGTVCELGEKYNVDTPINRTLFNMIRTIEVMK